MSKKATAKVVKTVPAKAPGMTEFQVWGYESSWEEMEWVCESGFNTQKRAERYAKGLEKQGIPCDIVEINLPPIG